MSNYGNPLMFECKKSMLKLTTWLATTKKKEVLILDKTNLGINSSIESNSYLRYYKYKNG